MFAMTRRPSDTMYGTALNASSSSTSWASPRVAAVPDPIAIPRSASLRASASLTPSPVMATTWPARCSDSTIARFCAGVTRPKTAPAATASSKPAASGSGSDRASTGASAPRTPSWAASVPTVCGWSPDSTFTVTPSRARKASVCAASARNCSANSSRATGSTVSALTPVAGSGSVWVRPSRSTRRPASVAVRRGSAPAPLHHWGARTSGAPSSHTPYGPKSTAANLRVDENGTAATDCHPDGALGQATWSARMVAFGLLSAAAKAAIAASAGPSPSG